jgi:hypothetical protein
LDILRMLYFFHIRDEAGLIRDEEGSDLPNLAAAYREARQSARDLVADDMRRGVGVAMRSIEITDAAGTLFESYPVRRVMG